VEVYRVEAEIEEFDVEQQEAGATALTGPQNTKNDVEVAKKTQVEKAEKQALPPTLRPVRPRPPTSSRSKVAEISAKHQLLQEN
jgi:hypothetical protein